MLIGYYNSNVKDAVIDTILMYVKQAQLQHIFNHLIDVLISICGNYYIIHACFKYFIIICQYFLFEKRNEIFILEDNINRSLK